MRSAAPHVKQRVGHQIKAARRQAGMSHDTLAARAGTSRSHLIKLEHGHHFPGDRMLSAIAEATGQPLEFFQADDDEDPDPLMGDLMRALIAVIDRHSSDSRSAATV